MNAGKPYATWPPRLAGPAEQPLEAVESEAPRRVLVTPHPGLERHPLWKEVPPVADIMPPPIHLTRDPAPDWANAFWSLVEVTDDCWLWNGSRTRAGYGQFSRAYASYLWEILRDCGHVSRGWVVATLDYRHAVEFEATPPKHLKVMRLGVWVKTNPTPQLSGDRPAQGWESIAYMHRDDRRSKWNGGGSHGNYVAPIPPPEGHPTAKPLPLVSQWVRWFTQPGETILDPFAGSGTTLRAAKDEGRKAIGVELDERYCEVIAKRLSQDTLFGGVA